MGFRVWGFTVLGFKVLGFGFGGLRCLGFWVWGFWGLGSLGFWVLGLGGWGLAAACERRIRQPATWALVATIPVEFPLKP